MSLFRLRQFRSVIGYCKLHICVLWLIQSIFYIVSTFLAHLERKLDPYRFLFFSEFFPIFFPILIKNFLYDAQNDKKNFLQTPTSQRGHNELKWGAYQCMRMHAHARTCMRMHACACTCMHILKPMKKKFFSLCFKMCIQVHAHACMRMYVLAQYACTYMHTCACM